MVELILYGKLVRRICYVMGKEMRDMLGKITLKSVIAGAVAAAAGMAFLTGCGGNANAKTVTIEKAEDLANYTIGCQSGTTGETWYLDNIKGKEPKGFKSGMDAALALKNGQIDAIVLDELPAKAIVSKNSQLKILDIKFAKEQYAIAVAKGNTELLDSINGTIKAMKDMGEYEKLVEAFMPADGNIKIPENVAMEGEKVLKMGTNAAFPPFEYVEGDKIVGFDITMSQMIARDFGAKLEVSDMAFDSLVAALQSGTIDMAVAGMSVTEDRLKSVDFSESYYESEQVIIVKQ